jgi:type IV pilus assembly protein PilN
MWSCNAEVSAVILINLLPHREERRKRRKVAFFVGLGIASAVGLAIAGVWLLAVQQMISSQQERNSFLHGEIAKLDLQIKDIRDLRAEIESLKARQKAVEDLQIDRNLPVHLLNELVAQTPEGVYFSSVKQEDQILAVGGIAQTQERVSEFLRNTGSRSNWLMKPELVETKAASVQANNSRELKRLFDFSVRVSVKRPQDAKPADAADSAASAASVPASPTSSPKI